ncbi:MAG: integrin [Acidobacteria bacterium]|nr:integrin [Acidobacteriota bacterium]
MTRFPLAAAALVCGGAILLAQAPSSLTQTAIIKASNAEAYDHFGEGGALPGHTGNTVALSRDGSTVAVGAPHEASGAAGSNPSPSDNSTMNAGAVYVYARSGSNWTQQAYLKPSNPQRNVHFGSVVALSDDGNTLAVAAAWESSAATGINGNQKDLTIPQAGAVYVFVRSGGRWLQQAYVKASNTGNRGEGDLPGEGDQFGFSLALSGDGNTLAVGAPSEDSAATGVNGNQRDEGFNSAGAVYVYTRTGGAWTQRAYLKADAHTNTGLGDQFGFSVALSENGGTLAVGVYDESGNGRTVNAPINRERGGSGAVYIWTRAGNAWTKQAYLKTWNAEGGDSWGSVVSLSSDGSTLAVGSLDEDCLCAGVHTNPETGIGDQKADMSSGGAAVFVRNGTAWSQQAYLKASNPGQDDWFGVRLALSGDGNALVVAAPNEDSNGRGVNAANNDGGAESGAAYLFVRAGGAWRQTAYIKAANADQYDEFGNAVAFSRDGRTLLVGARGEDSAPTAGPADNSVDEAGAVYVFTR